VVCVVPSFYPVIALMLADGVCPADCFHLPRDAAEAFAMLQTPEGRRSISFVLRKPVGDIPWTRFDAQVEAIQRYGARVVTFLDAEYPPYLRDIPQSPPILFSRGDTDCLSNRGIAIVGSRRATARGVAFARALAGGIAALGIPVTSGAALGIDTAARSIAAVGRSPSWAQVSTYRTPRRTPGSSTRSPAGDASFRSS
jgi:DNA processing protein